MKWKEVRERYPDSWVLFEAIEAYSENGERKVTNISIINTFDNSEEATEVYRKTHKKNPQRELYIAHTQKEQLKIEERKWLGIRV